MTRRNATFSVPALFVLLCGGALTTWAHPNLTGHWTLIPQQSTYNGQPATQTGDITIEQRHGQLFISRHLYVDSESGGMEFNFTTDGHENSTIHQGKEMKTKASWEGDTLKLRTKMNGEITIEQYRLSPEHDQLVLTVEMPNHQISTMVFQRA